MSPHYDPGAPAPYFTKHKYHGIPINRNITPIDECQIKGYVGIDAKACRGIAVELLTPEYLWLTFQREAESIISQNGKVIEDPIIRNKCINAAYANLWLADNRFQWAGLAAFASKQVGCGLLHSADVIEKNQHERQSIHLFKFSSPATVAIAEAAAAKQRTAEASARTMSRRLGHGNLHLFLDIYPLHRFYMERGWKEFEAYLKNRQNKYQVYWDVENSILPFGKPFQDIRDGFKLIDEGGLKRSVQYLAHHEQVNVLQAIMYNDRLMQQLLAMNQLAWATSFPTGDYQEIQLTLSAQCKANSGSTVWFSKDIGAKLWNVNERMKFVLSAADRFDDLINGPERLRVEASIRSIAAGGGVT